MLCASLLAELEASAPHKIVDEASEEEDSDPSPYSSVSSSVSSSTEEVRNASVVAVAKPSEAHSQGHTEAINSIEKWVLAALASMGKGKTDLASPPPSVTPNNQLASEVLTRLTQWFVDKKTAREVGVVDDRPSILCKTAPRDNQRLAKAWMRRYINTLRTEHGVGEDLDRDWGKDLSGGRANAKQVSKSYLKSQAEKGDLYHHKHDLAPTQEQLTKMMWCGFVADPRVDENILDALEAGMAIALYMPTGARGSELKSMNLQTIGIEDIPHEKSGLTFTCIKLTAFQTKTRLQHLNQCLAHTNPWRCGIGLLGVSILLRVKNFGPPPFRMETDEQSWKVIGTNVRTLDRRLKALFRVAGVRRQSEDPITYLGRHHGTRLLQHSGGSTEGGAARRGHGSSRDASAHYTECPLPDMLRIASNDPDTPFCAAHLHPDTESFANDVVDCLFPQLRQAQETIEARQRQIDARGSKADRLRKEEHTNDLERFIKAMRYCCLVGVRCLVARPRTWKQWKLLEDESSIWESYLTSGRRLLSTLFSGNGPAVQAMNHLALKVREHEMNELRLASERKDSDVAFEIRRMAQASERREDLLREQHERLLHEITSALRGATTTPSAPSAPSAPPPSAPPPEPSRELSVFESPEPLAGCKAKNKRMRQDAVVCFSEWNTMTEAFHYAIDDLAPRERAHGAKWRIQRLEDGRQCRSVHKQFLSYRRLCIAVAMRMSKHAMGRDAALKLLDELLSARKTHRQFLLALEEEQKNVENADVLFRDVFFSGGN